LRSIGVKKVFKGKKFENRCRITMRLAWAWPMQPFSRWCRNSYIEGIEARVQRDFMFAAEDRR
jgi:hypothetical protein